MENTRQRKQFHKQAGIWLVALFVVLAAAFMRGKVNVRAAETLTVKIRINDKQTNWGYCSYSAIRGSDILLTVEAETTNVDKEGKKKLTYEWKKEGEDAIKGTESSLQVKKGEGDEEYTCLVSDGNEEEECSFELLPTKTLEEDEEESGMHIIYKGKYYSCSENDDMNIKMGDELQLVMPRFTSTYGNVKYKWYKHLDSEYSESNLIATTDDNKLSVKKEKMGMEYYDCEVTDGNIVQSYSFKVAPVQTLSSLQKINGEVCDSFQAILGEDVTLEIEASTDYVNEEGKKEIFYKWEKWDKDKEEYVGCGEDKNLNVTKGVGKEEYTCVVSDNNVTKTYYFKLYPAKSLSVKQYINDDEISTLDNAVLGENYTLKVNAESSYSNQNLKYVWWTYDFEGEPIKKIAKNVSQLTVQISADEDISYGCEISDGNQEKLVEFKLNPEILADIEAFVNGDAYDFKTVTVGENQPAVLKLKVTTSSGVRPTYSWSKRDMSIPSSLGKEYLPIDNTTNTYVAKATTDTYDEYRCIITVDGMSYTKYFYLQRGTLNVTGSVKADNDIVEKEYGAYYVKENQEVTLQIKAKTFLTDLELTYQWFSYNEDTDEGKELKGEDKESYTFKAQNNQEYYCLVSNGQDSRKIYFEIRIENSNSNIQTEQYIQGEKADSFELDDLSGTIELKVKATSNTGEKLKYCWYEQTEDNYYPYGESNKILQEGSNDTYILDCSKIKNKQITICCNVSGESYNYDDDESSDIAYCTFNIALKNYTTGAKTFIKTETEEKEENLITVPEGTELTLRVEPSQNERDLTYTWYNKEAKKQGEGKSLPVTKGSAKDIYYCVVSDGNYTTRYTFTLKKEIICKHENIITDKEVEPTCTKTGLSEGSHCVDCDEVIKEQKVLSALGHKWDEGTITKQPSITEEGIREYKCLNAGCQETKTEKIAKLPKPEEPSTEPEKPSTEPTKPSTGETKPSKDDKVPATEAPKKNTGTTQKTLKVGTKVIDKKSKAVYKVTGKKTVQYIKSSVKNIKTVNIPATITVNKVKYQVTSIAAKAVKGNKKLTKVIIPASIKNIGAQAFAGCKNLKNITIKTPYLTKKNVGAKAFKGISAKAVIKVPKKQLKAYQKMLISKGVSKKAKIKK